MKSHIKFMSIPGLNIQAPWSELILTGKKTIETRGYSLPKKYENTPMAVIETPGPKKLVKKARVVGVVIFSHSIRYKDKEQWENDQSRHLVDVTDPQFRFRADKPKYGWVVKAKAMFETPLPPPKVRGIIFASKCRIPALSLHLTT